MLLIPSNSEANVNGVLQDLSEQLIRNVKMETETHELEATLANYDFAEMTLSLRDDQEKKAFWINIYNSYFQLLASREDKKKSEIFTGKFIEIANIKFSLDDIEHGILRRYRAKWSMGYLPKICTSKEIKTLAVSKLDYRIHFALNCGAISCPPIFFYQTEKIDAQLASAENSFLNSETQIDEKKKIVRTSKILKWYKNDFGGKKGTLKILSRIKNQNLNAYSLKYAKYDWAQKLNNFQ